LHSPPEPHVQVAPAWAITLRGASQADADALATLRVRAMRESLEQLGRFDAERARARFLSNFEPSFTRHIVQDGKTVGFVVVRPHDTQLLLDHLYIQPGHQGQGVGAAVLAIVFSEADGAGKDLRVGALKQSRANDFYVRHGFQPVEQGEWDNYYLRRASGACPDLK
jgi:ribosomal protein S18 acetylase RimI-like enzyme